MLGLVAQDNLPSKSPVSRAHMRKYQAVNLPTNPARYYELLDDAQTRHHIPCTLLSPIVGIDCSLFTHHSLPMIFIKLLPFLVCCGRYILAHSQHEGHTRWVVFPAEFFKYFVVGEWFGQVVAADVVEIENASHFVSSSEATVGNVVEGEDIWLGKSFRQSIQDESAYASFTHSFMLFPKNFCSSDKLVCALPS